MEEFKMTTFSRKHAILFTISTLAMILMMVFMPQMFWVVLPFVCTFFVQMMGWM